MTDLHNQLKRQIRWSKKTFGPGDRTDALLKKLQEEMKEVEADPTSLEEWIDLLIISLDGAWRCVEAQYSEYDFEEIASTVASALLQKQKINEKRQWPDWKKVGRNKPLQHIS